MTCNMSPAATHCKASGGSPHARLARVLYGLNNVGDYKSCLNLNEENLQFSNFGLERPQRSSEVIGGQLIRYRRDSLHFSSNGKFQNQTVTQNIINFIDLNFCAKMFKSRLSKSICNQK